MSKIAILTDSSCDIPQEMAEKYGIDIMSFHILLDDVDYVERVDCTNTEFYDKMRAAKGVPSTAAITPIQLAMTVSLGAVFGIQLTQSAAAAALASVTAATVGRAVSQVLVGWIPGLGNAINASTAAALTESVGWLLAKEFAGQSWAD